MKDLIEALLIFQKYLPKDGYPTWCEHDVLHVCCSSTIVSNDDMLRLETLGFFKSDYEEQEFLSYKYGSC